MTTDEARPNRRATRLGIRLVIAVAVPLVIYLVGKPLTGSDLSALTVAGTVPLLVTGVLSVVRRRIEPLFVLSGGAFLVAVIVAILSRGNTVLLKVPDAPFAMIGGLVLIGSVAVRRPLLTTILRRIGRIPRTVDPRRGAVPSLIVGATLLIHGALRILLAVELDTTTFFAVGRVATWGVLAAGFVCLIAYRRVRTRRIPS